MIPKDVLTVVFAIDMQQKGALRILPHMESKLICVNFTSALASKSLEEYQCQNIAFPK